MGRFLTEKGINVRAMKSKLADLWKPAMGINIKALKTGLYLFQFYHKEDMKWMMTNGPWSFDGAMLVTGTIPMGEDPTKVPLNEIDFWIQIYDLPSGYMVESVGKQLGNFFGKFLLYDPSNSSSIWREYMRIRIRVDVRLPLKRKKKISRKNKSEIVVNCKYEKLGDFCFLCGLLSHTERFCRKKFEGESSGMVKEWGGWLRAPLRRAVAQERSRWLRDDRDEDWGGKYGRDGNQGFQNTDFTQGRDKSVVNQEKSNDRAIVTGDLNRGIRFGKSLEGNSFSKNNIGLGHEELTGLELEERIKRKRVGPEDNMICGNEDNTNNMDSVLSHFDCTETASSVLAPLARQASHPQ